MKFLALLAAIGFVTFIGSAGPRTFKGQIMDSQCAYNVHSTTASHKEMSQIYGGLNARDCTIMCVEKNDGRYVFLDRDGKTAYKLSSDQKDLKQYAGKKVEIIGEVGPKKDFINVTQIKPLE
ncbi:MAG: hypothetical protein WBE20_16130 [Candidatus Acidiferrales bacterium]